MFPQRHSLSGPHLSQHRGCQRAGMDCPEAREAQLKVHPWLPRNRRSRPGPVRLSGEAAGGLTVEMGLSRAFFQQPYCFPGQRTE